MSRIITLLFAVSLAALGLSACGDDSGGSDSGTPDNPRRITLDAEEFAFSPDAVTVAPGETIEFVVANNGDVEHEFVVTNQPAIDEHIEGGHEEHTEDGDTEGMEDGTMADGEMEMEDAAKHEIKVAVGETGTLVVTFAADAGELTHFVCLIPGHYEAGMVGDITYSS